MVVDQWIPVILIAVVGAFFPLVTLGIGKLLRPNSPNEVKTSSYECGEQPKSGAWVRFNIRFYVTGLTFLIFDVEAALMFPVARVFREEIMKPDGEPFLALIKVGFFVLTLVVGLAYGWKKGDLDWVRSFKKFSGQPRSASPTQPPPASLTGEKAVQNS
jgi:NADH-quinone oxidoreductase subunit A